MQIVEPLWQRFTKMWIAEAQRLRERLGQHQDLEVLRTLDRAAPAAGALAHAARAGRSTQRKRRHVAAAKRIATRLFVDKPGAFRRRLERDVGDRLIDARDGGAHFARDRRDQLRPRLPALLTPHPHARIPRALVPVAEPVPDARVSMRHHHEGRPAERAGEMRRGVADGHDRVAGAHQRRKPVEIVGVVDVGQPLDADAELALDRLALGAGVAVLQIDEAAAGRPQQRREIGEPRALLRAADRRLADPGQADHGAAVVEPLRAAPACARRRRRDSRARASGTSSQLVRKWRPRPAIGSCAATGPGIERGRERDHRHAGERAREQASPAAARPPAPRDPVRCIRSGIMLACRISSPSPCSPQTSSVPSTRPPFQRGCG